MGFLVCVGLLIFVITGFAIAWWLVTEVLPALAALYFLFLVLRFALQVLARKSVYGSDPS